ncbi:MAG: hypothetical protein Q8L66_09175 [Caulobacter sp.]|nr:hypothetical protein [Caulobacter sp.]
MMTPGLFIVAVIGLLAGAVARRMSPGQPSRFAALIAGCGGGVLGIAGSHAIGLPIQGAGPLILAAVVGAVILLGLRALIVRR